MKTFIVRYKFVLIGLALVVVILAALGIWLTRPAPQVAEVPLVGSFPTDEWQTSTPEEQGMDSSKTAEGLLAFAENGTKIHSLMIIRHGAKLLDAYFYPYDGAIYHDLASVSKSIMTTLIGIAVDQGKLTLDQTMLSFFPERTIANLDKNKVSITIRNLVSMSSGLDCGEDNEATTQEMRHSPDWVQFILDRPMVSVPGKQFSYCNMDMHMLSVILQKATGMSALEFAKQYLFAPLGITDYYWPADQEGNNYGWGDVALYPDAIARIGYLFLHKGLWEDKQVISEDWIQQATSKQIATPSSYSEDYGFGWWVSRPDAEIATFSAQGRQGQRILVVPAMDLVEVTTGGGFEMSEIDPYMLATIKDLENPVPANPAGVEQLKAALAKIVQGPEPMPVNPLPDTAAQVSGKTYQFDSNPFQIQSARLDFTSPETATLWLGVAGEKVPRKGSVGLDGVFRATEEGRPWLARGEWLDDSTFQVEYNEGPGLAYYFMVMKFDGDRMTFELKDAAHTNLGVMQATSD